MRTDSKLLSFIVLTPIISTLLYLLVSSGYYIYSHMLEYDERVVTIEKDFLENKKTIIKNRVDLVMDFIHFKQQDENLPKQKAQKEIEDFVNNIRYEDGSYVFVYELLDINGGNKFAKMVINPNRKDLIGRYVSDEYKDAKGKEFRKEFLEDIRKYGESFVRYYYKKLDTNEISEKLSYFRLDGKWNWIVATGVYLDGSKKIIENEKHIIQKSVESNIYMMAFVAFILLVVSVYISLLLLKLIRKKLVKYKADILETKKDLVKKNNQLKEQIYVDMLTKKLNRRALLESLEKDEFAILLLIDIDEFKLINELYGSEGGNVALIGFVELLEQYRDACECGYEIYRIGSDEFALLFDKNENDIEFYEGMIFELNDFISKSEIRINDDMFINLDTTMGISFDRNDALIKAEIALSTAKNKRKRYLTYSLAIDNRINSHESIMIKREISLAIANDNIIPYFQPIVDCDKNIIKYEALIRLMTTVTKEVLSPIKFLNVAKKIKLYPELSHIMIEKTFDRFKDESSIFSLNISILDIQNSETMHFIEKIIHQNKDTAKRLVFEILESEGVEDFEVLSQFIDKMRGFGVKIAIDDFGSGYSSFKYILKIKPDYIKIDGSLIENVDKDEYSKIMVKTIVNVAKDMKSITVAEFVHSKEVFDTLVELGVDEFQGYYISKPLQTL